MQENAYDRQQLAGVILFEICPECPLELDGCVYGSAQHWNLSVEELPWYWCKIFGHETVKSFLDELIAVSDERLSKSIKTMLFWAQHYESKNT